MQPNAFSTHAVTNQASELAHYNAATTDTALLAAQQAFHAAWAAPQLQAFGALAGGEMMALGVEANQHKPQLQAFDRFGHRIDLVKFHPSYHRLMQLGSEHGVSSFAWRHAHTPGAHVARAGLLFLHGQAETGSLCPLTMTYASVPSLRMNTALANDWLPRVTAAHYDGSSVVAMSKAGLTIGMGMTEKQGGSDVRANTTRAQLLKKVTANDPDTAYGDLMELVGHKWFFSAPMCDAHLVLAQEAGEAGDGVSCFLVPRLWHDGTPNNIRIQRLKDKLGNWSNASAEVEFTGAKAWRLGQPGRGITNILEMVALTRQDCALGSAAIMRQALVQAIHHTRERHAFGKRLVEHALMQNVLADLALESEAATWLSMRLAYAVDRSAVDEHQAAFARIATAIGKYWICKRTTPMVNEAQECFGGAGYVEENSLARLLREAPLNSIWEGSGNVQCLDVLRALSREPACLEALTQELYLARGQHALFD
jgi:putative acyl-CoA dehydrogenase